MRILLPEYLNIEDIHEEGRETIQNYNENKTMRFLYLFQEICKRAFYYLGRYEVEIYSKKLQRISKVDYVEYVALLESLKILNVNHYYDPDKGECKKYSYAPLYAEKYFLHKINRRKDVFIRNVNIRRRRYNYSDDILIKRLNDFFSFLNFDINAAIAYSDKLKDQRIANPDINPFAKGWVQTNTDKWYWGRKPSEKNIEEQHKYEMWQIDKWEDRFFDGFRDSTSKRFHSLLTTLPKEFKRFITIGAKKETIYSLDIKNSQPFFSLVLMNPQFWYYPEMPTNFKKIYVKYFEEPNSPALINIKTIEMENAFSSTIYSYLIKILHELGDDYESYKKSILAGTLYEDMGKRYEEHLEIKMARGDIKTSLFMTIFSSNKFIGQPEAKPKKLFSEIFPTVYNVMAAIKCDHSSFVASPLADKSYKLLSIMLQRIESYMILDVISTSLMNKYPGQLPIYTIHDSVCSTEEFLPIIETEIKLKINEYTGLTPKLDQQKW